MMDQKQIEEIVRSVMASMGQPQTTAAAPQAAVTKCASQCEVAAESCELDLGSSEAKAWIGVQQPHRAEVLAELKRIDGLVTQGRAFEALKAIRGLYPIEDRILNNHEITPATVEHIRKEIAIW